MELISFGGMYGCTSAIVAMEDSLVSDAVVKINSVTLVADSAYFGTPLYLDTLGLINYKARANYTLSVSHHSVNIAQGSAIMPTAARISNIKSPHNHQLNTPLTLKWDAVDYASSIVITTTSTITDPVYGTTRDVTFESPLLPPDSRQYTIPDTLFSAPGTYNLGIISYNGLNPGTVIDSVTSDEGLYGMSYNISGAAGIFLVGNAYPDAEGFIINIGQTTASKGITAYAEARYTLKEHLERRNQRILRSLRKQ